MDPRAASIFRASLRRSTCGLIDMRMRNTTKKHADLTGFGCAALFSIKDADGTDIRIFQFCEYAMPADDVSVGVWNGRKVKTLGDEGAITIQ